MATQSKRTRFSTAQIPATLRCQSLSKAPALHARLFRVPAWILQDGNVHGLRFHGRTPPSDCISVLPVAGGAATTLYYRSQAERLLRTLSQSRQAIAAR